jgi:NAD(P)-dependent dehydrogenase (short-subunit alcohol dehydrogenase family)
MNGELLQPAHQFDINGSVAFVTGTNKKNGIGYAIVEALLAKGSKKVYATARDASQLDELVAKGDGRVVAVSLDVTDVQAVAKLGSEYPDVTLVVNNAGISFANHLTTETSSESLEFARKEMEVNYLGPMAIVKSFAPVFAKTASSEYNAKSAIVNLASISSLINFPVVASYSCSKAAVHSLTQAQRRELPNSLVVGLYPGPIDTALIKDIPGFEGAPVSEVVDSLINALQNGIEDNFPDAMAKGLHEGWKAGAKAIEIKMAETP